MIKPGFRNVKDYPHPFPFDYLAIHGAYGEKFVFLDSSVPMKYVIGTASLKKGLGNRSTDREKGQTRR